MLHYDTGSDEETLWGLGLGCEGAVDVHVQRVDTAWMDGPGRQMRELLDAGTPFAPITVLTGPSAGRTFVLARSSLEGTSGSEAIDRQLAHAASLMLEGDGSAGMLELGGDTAFVDVLRPPPRLFIFGAGDDARPLASLAAQAGFEVTVVDHRPAYLTPERFPPPLRIVLPWKYGFKSAKAIVRIRFTEKEPVNSWKVSAPQEYGFYANVNPNVDHPRWSQASEQRIGESGRRKTLMFNGYGDQVAGLYAGMDLDVHY